MPYNDKSAKAWDSVWMDASGEVWGKRQDDHDSFVGLGFGDRLWTAQHIINRSGGPLVRMQPHPRVHVDVQIDDALRAVTTAQRALTTARERAGKALEDS